jgi:hypothetical protein
MMADFHTICRRLLEAASHFERVAAHHKRIEAERKALQDAITDAQLVLSVEEGGRKKRGPDGGSEKPPAPNGMERGNGKAKKKEKPRWRRQ